ILAGGIDADVELGLGMLLVQLLQALLQGLIALAVFLDGERLGGRLAIGAEEGNAVTVACGVNTHTDTVQRLCRGHDGSPKQSVQPDAVVRSGREEGVSLLRYCLGQVILVISGPRRLMYQSL